MRSRPAHRALPPHRSLRVGTLSGILADVAVHLGVDREALAEDLFGK